MKSGYLFATAIIVVGFLWNPGKAVAAEAYYFQCGQDSSPYQISFHPDLSGAGAVQKRQSLRSPDGPSEEAIVTNFSVTKEGVFYTKRWTNVRISRDDGMVFNDNQATGIVCQETSTDQVAAAKAKIELAKTTQTEFWSMATGHTDTDFVHLGQLATTDDICRVLDHPFFSLSATDYALIDRTNSSFSWDGIEAASLWIDRKLRESGVRLTRFFLMENIHDAANKNISNCLSRREEQDPEFYQNLTRNFLTNLHYRGVECHKQAYVYEQYVDDEGNLTNREIAADEPSCIDFGYNSGYLGGWNSSTFTLMLIWREAHPVLEKILDTGLKVVDRREQMQVARQAAEQERQIAQQAVEQERQALRAQQEARMQQAWRDYSAREKTVMEQVYNLATSGFVEGRSYSYWVEGRKCELTDGSRTIDNRSLNMTAFRIYNELIGTTWGVVSSDQNTTLVTLERVPIDRLQNAWGVAFSECPGTESRF